MIWCFTTALVVLLGAVGLSALTGYLDYVLLPALALCLGLICYGLYKGRQRAADCCDTTVANETSTST